MRNESPIHNQKIDSLTKTVWGQPDSNWRRPKSRDLQSLAIATMRHPRNAGERNRTLNRPITSRVLYQLSYSSVDYKSYQVSEFWSSSFLKTSAALISCPPEETRSLKDLALSG